MMSFPKKSMLISFVLSIFFLGYTYSTVIASTYYVAINGSDSSGTGSSASPWQTIGFGIGRMASGDTLMIKDGIYTDRGNFINSNLTPIPNGTPSAYTTIKAENTLKVRITNTSTLDYYDNPLRLDGNYIKVDGIIIDLVNTEYPPFNAEINGNRNKVTQMIFRREGHVDNWGGWAAINGDYNLLEDIAGVGAARYGYTTGGPSATSNHNIFRRVIGRVDYSNSNQPKATFAFYGNDGPPTNVHDIICQNCVAIDGRAGPTNGDVTYSGFYAPKVVENLTVIGSIVLNVEAVHSGFLIKETLAKNVKLMNSLSWGTYGPSGPSGIRTGGEDGPMIFDHVTVGEALNGYYTNDGGAERVLKNSLFINNSNFSVDNGYGWTTFTNNAFFPPEQAKGLNPVTSSVSLKHIIKTETGTGLENAADDGGHIGATILYQYGVSGTLWGEPGYNQLTTTPLWPWKNEAIIKQVFQESNVPPSNASFGTGVAHYNVPSSNNSKRGFSADNSNLTSYIWNYLGYPTFVRDVTVSPGNQKVMLSWTANAGAENVTAYRIYFGDSPGNYNASESPITISGATSKVVTTFNGSPLINGSPYYFMIVAVDSDNDVGATFRNEVSTISVPIDITTPSNGFKIATGNYRAFTVSGTTDPNTSVEILIGGKSFSPMATAVANGSGVWSTTVDFMSQTEGPIGLKGVAGGVTSATITGIYDITPPAPPSPPSILILP